MDAAVLPSQYCVDVFAGVCFTSWLMCFLWVVNLSDGQPLMEGLPDVAAGEFETGRAGFYSQGCHCAILA